ncbi:hypothetical protein MOVS_06420 [Moraxella ovis]|uniref:Transposase and inactivated derivatives n=2 Tax=Moraxella ovis TaxID=29433 RepID=A0A378PMI3_9GAMM|nr:transposase family protein [Moraxella ovis]ANB91677.1 hypothetical protein MOVS_06420 [Moraxella ovis]STY87340.1 Transposase and inactivated derivatives [Moraxella ovis]
MIDLLSLADVESVRIENHDEAVTIYAKTTYHLVNCLNCGGGLYKHGSREYCYTDTPLYMKPTTLQISARRYRCKVCK